jgi:outer membrane protein
MVLLSGSAWAQAQGRTATVDLAKVLENYWKKSQAQATLKERIDDVDKEIKNMVDDLKKMKDEYDLLVKSVSDPAISPAERDKREADATEKRRRFNEMNGALDEYRRTSQIRIEDQKNRLMSNLLKDITNAVSAKAKSTGFSLVVDTSAVSVSGAPVFVFSNNENDLTDSVLLQLNATAPADAFKPSEKPSEKPAEKPEEKKKSGKK